MLNRAKLKGKIREMGLTQMEVAVKMGISYVTLSKKLNGKVRFYEDEIAKLFTILDLSADEKEAIFFSDNCTLYAKNELQEKS
mgnify:CR=1 FL=1